MTNNAGGITDHNRVSRNIFSYDTASSDDGVLANRDTAQEHCTTTNRRSMLDESGLEHPVLLGGKLAARVRGSGKTVVDKDHVMSYKHSVFYGDALTNKRVAPDLAIRPDVGAFLYLDERSNLGAVSNLATIQIHEAVNLDSLAEPYVVRYTLADTTLLSSIHTSSFPFVSHGSFRSPTIPPRRVSHTLLVFTCLTVDEMFAGDLQNPGADCLSERGDLPSGITRAPYTGLDPRQGGRLCRRSLCHNPAVLHLFEIATHIRAPKTYRRSQRC